MHKNFFGGEFPLGIGSLDAFPSIQSAHHSERDMIHFHLFSHIDRGNFDPYGIAQKMANKKFKHKDHIEDYWAKCIDEMEVIRRK